MAGFKQPFLDLQESYLVKRRKAPDNVAEAVELADDLVNHDGEAGAQVSKNLSSAVLSSKGPEVVSLLASAKAGSDTPPAAAKLAKGEHKVAFAKVLEER